MSETRWTPGRVMQMSGMCHAFIKDEDGELVGRIDARPDDATAAEACRKRVALAASAPALYGALDEAFGFAAAWAGYYQALHALPDLHPGHAETLAKAKAALSAARGEPAKGETS